jgi:hypothetical protein
MSGRRSYLPFPAEVPGSSGESGGGGGAGGNYAAIDRGAPANSSVGPATFVVAAIVLTPVASGMFRIVGNLGGTDSSSEVVTLTLLAAEQAVAGTPITLTGGTAAAQIGNGATPVTSLGETSTVAGTGIGIVGGGVAKTLATKTVQAVGTDPIELSISGLFTFSTGGVTKTPFVLDETCVLYLAVTAAAGTISAMNCDFSAQEQASA